MPKSIQVKPSGKKPMAAKGAPAPPTPPPIKHEPTDFVTGGQALTLADLAEAKGMHVADVCEFPALLKEAGLPESPSHHIRQLAHRLNRDKTDGGLFRSGWLTFLLTLRRAGLEHLHKLGLASITIKTAAPELTMPQAEEALEATTKREEAKEVRKAEREQEKCETVAPVRVGVNKPRIMGMSRKETLYRLWLKDKSITFDKALAAEPALDGLDPKLAKLWLTRNWPEGRYLPGCAKGGAK